MPVEVREKVRALEPIARLAVDSDRLDLRVRSDLLEDDVVDARGELREERPRIVRRPVDERDHAARRRTGLEVDLVGLAEGLWDDDIEVRSFARLRESDLVAQERDEPGLHRNGGQFLDALDRDAAEVEELEDCRARLRNGEDRSHRNGENRERDQEHAARYEPRVRRGLSDPAEDALLQVRLGRLVEAGAEIAQGELELRHTTPPPCARAGARARARAWT